ncbi:hypothetical protein RhiirB3_392861 [Rhizophagus irregularis]|nr:hypothetical protein RhiirB3_392861 [Rhizophagus irregularis]
MPSLCNRIRHNLSKLLSNTILANAGSDQRWETSRETLEKEGIAKDWNVIVVLQFAIKPSFRNLPEHVFIESKLLNVMEKVDNKPIEIENLIHRMALDVLGRADFGFDFNDVQKNEILRVLGDNLMLSVKRQKELKYINMVINENLRLYPPNWEDPEKFIPERFENEKHDHYAWLSFGGGNRLCLLNKE